MGATKLHAERLVLHRGEHRLTVTPRGGRFDLAVNGGGNVTEDEFAQIAAFLEDRDGADAFLSKVRTRMERTGVADVGPAD